MGEIRSNGGNTKYYSVVQNAFRRRVSEDNPDAEKRETQNNKIVHEIVLSGLEGRITGVKYEPSREYGNKIIISMVDGDEKLEISLGADSKPGRSFVQFAENINPSEDVQLFAFADKNATGDKIPTVLFAKQNGEGIKFLHTSSSGTMPDCSDWEDEDEVEAWRLQRKRWVTKHLKEVIIPHFDVEPQTAESDDPPF